MPRLALSLAILRAEVDWLWPTRSRATDGWIGDVRHVTRTSDHNPDARGIVRALDVTAAGINPSTVVAAACHHPSTRYVIWDHEIYSRRYGFRPIPYHGDDPHTSHVHVSIRRGPLAPRRHRRWIRLT